MNNIQPFCENCIYSGFHFCKKFNKKCISIYLNKKIQQIACYDCIVNNSYQKQMNNSDNIMIDTNNTAYFHFPGPENLKLIKSLQSFQQYYPEACYANRKIIEIYGNWPGAIWNGRSPDFNIPTVSLEQIINFKEQIEELGLSMNLTWNNHLIKGNALFDTYCNNITEIFHNGKHSITVASLELFHYLKEKYPKFQYYQSVIMSSNDDIFIKKDNFDMFLWPRNLNNNWEKLLNVPANERQYIEFLCDDLCTPICDRMVHYNLVNDNLLNRKQDTSILNNYCSINHDFSQYNLAQYPITITSKDIDEYLKYNYCHFKLAGRYADKIEIILKLTKYFIKQDFFEDGLLWLYFEKTQNEILRRQKYEKKYK